MQGQLLSFGSPSRGEQRTTSGNSVTTYIAVALDESAAKDGAEKLRALTPRLMQWSENIWLLDIRPCSTYWGVQARQRGENVYETVRQVLTAAFSSEQTAKGKMAEGTAAPVSNFYAASAGSPWAAIVLASQMYERKLPGFIDLSSSFAVNLYREVSWDNWFSCVQRLGVHFQSKKRRAFNEDTLRRQCTQMEQSVKRLGIAMPWHMRTMDSMSIKRRFGVVLQEVWEWTFSILSTSSTLTSAMATPSLHQDDGFPWTATEVVETPTVARHLEYPLVEWDYIEPVLKEDLDKLCDLSTWDTNERVLSLEWRLVFPDMTCLCVPIPFRHPHYLRQEKGLHKTALLQARYSFEAAIPGSQLDISRLDEHLPTMPIVSWQVSITERLAMPPVLRNLFGGFSSGFDDDGESHPLAMLVSLENKLPAPLECYDFCNDWVPEDSFDLVTARERSLGSSYSSGQGSSAKLTRNDSAAGNDAYRSLRGLGCARPLFLYRKPQVFDPAGKSTAWIFCERTMDKWWRQAEVNSPSAHQRDYYWLTDSDNRGLWVFKNNLGQAYVHGIFS